MQTEETTEVITLRPPDGETTLRMTIAGRDCLYLVTWDLKKKGVTLYHPEFDTIGDMSEAHLHESVEYMGDPTMLEEPEFEIRSVSPMDALSLDLYLTDQERATCLEQLTAYIISAVDPSDESYFRLEEIE